MKILYQWLKEFVDVSAAPEELRTRLSLTGTAVEALDETAAGPMLDAELASNRADCLGHYGVAREIAAIYRLPLKPITPKLRESAEKAATGARVHIQSPELCARYTARVLRGVNVGPSPEWLRLRLEALGQASINNVVDATNYVMLELGQPLHAFDLDLLHERRIIVRRAHAGEKMRTLDGVERALTPEICVIADAGRAVAVAGVMGGADSEIRGATRNILLESAWFDPISVRRTSKTLGLRTEASVRFERGADPKMADLASQRCAELIQQLAGAEVLAGVVDEYPGRAEAPVIELSRRELLRVMGSDVPDADITAILETLGFSPHRVTGSSTDAHASAMWKCRRPSWRGDVARDIDLIEEIARLYGLDKFPARLPAAKLPAARLEYADAEDRLRERLIGLGYQEVITIPIVDDTKDALFRPEGHAPARIANPLSEDASVMRSTGAVAMATRLEWNINHGQRNLRLFEIGRTYRWDGATPVETPVLTLGATGLAREKSIVEGEREFGFADLKGDLDQIGQLAGGFQWQSGAPEWLHPTHAGTLALGGAAGSANQIVGAAGKLARRIAENFKLRQDAYVAELALEPLYSGYRAARGALRYKPLSRLPAVERDFSLLLPEGTAFSAVAEIVRGTQIAELTSINAVDLFRGKGVPQGKYSLLVRVTFQSYDATLTEAQLSDFSGRIITALERHVGASLRV